MRETIPTRCFLCVEHDGLEIRILTETLIAFVGIDDEGGTYAESQGYGARGDYDSQVKVLLSSPRWEEIELGSSALP